MKISTITTTLAFALLLLSSSLTVKAQDESPARRVKEIQAALRQAGLDGWLFYDFRGSDPLAYRILKLDQRGITTRRWFYYIPATGEPVKIVHSIERGKLDQLPGRKLIYLPWPQLHEYLRETLRARRGPLVHVQSGDLRVYPRRTPRIAVQYSPNNDVPYMSRVDAGTIELIRSFGVEPVTSADLVQQFEAALSDEQRRSHMEAADKIHKIIMEGFDEIARRIRSNVPTTEYDIQQFMERRFAEENMTNDNDPPIIAVNQNAANPHYQPTREINSPIKRGDFVLFDVWAKFKTPGAVYADETWTGYVGETVPEKYTRIFNIVREARDAAVKFVQENMRAGRTIKGADVDDVSRGVIKRAGYGAQFIHRTGHSIGEEVHGNGANIDNLETRDSRKIIPRTCFSIEPGIYLEGDFGVRSEIDVYVSERDAQATGQPIQTEVVAILSGQKAMNSHFQTGDEGIKRFEANQPTFPSEFIVNDNRKAITNALLTLWFGNFLLPRANESVKLQDYEVHKVTLSKWEDGKFIATVTLSVKPTKESFRLWLSKSGKRNRGWIRDMKMFFTIVKENDHYKVQKVA